MKRVPWLKQVVSGFALFHAHIDLVTAANSSFQFDGTSSDMAQQFRNLYDAGYSASALSLSVIPSDVTTRLSKYSLSFADLPPLLQRAVLWDTGYVTQYGGEEEAFSTIYTSCSNASTMADIAVSLAQFNKTGCEVISCLDRLDNITITQRSNLCTVMEMASVNLCAVSDAPTPFSSSLWATGGYDALLPEPNVVRHNWTYSGIHYLIYAIHMANPEHEYGSCPSQASKNAMIIPCVPYDNSSDWCRPHHGSLVTSWLEERANGTDTSPGKSPTSSTNTPRTPPTLNIALLKYADIEFDYNGTSSDLALQYLKRYAAGDVADRITYDSIPSEIQDRLNNLGLKFAELDGLLQRALVWDMGYVMAQDSLVPIYTRDDRVMANIAIPRSEYEDATAYRTSTTCPDFNGGFSHRSENCTGDDMNKLVYCATNESRRNPAINWAMWADGGSTTDIPQPVLHYHNWAFNGSEYTIHAIHTGSDHEPAWNHCKSEEHRYYGAMIVPCRVYSNVSNLSNWARPTTSSLVDVWLEYEHENTKSWLKWWYILLLVLLLQIAVAGICSWYCKRRRAAAELTCQEQERQVLSPINGATPMNFNFVGLESGTENAPTINRGAMAGSSGERISAMDAIQILREDPVLASTKISLEALQLVRVLAKGGFGEVWMGYHHQTPVAIKKLLPVKQQFEFLQGFLEEIQLTSSFDHPNIIRYIGVAWTRLDDLCLVLEFLEKGDLQMFLRQNSNRLTWKDKYPIALGIGSAILCLHARRPAPVIHRDIKAKNVLLTEKIQPKLIDFGVSRDSVQETMTAGVGTPYWAAPEVLEGNRYTEQSDIYSFGVLLSELDTAETPFDDARSKDGNKLSAFQILNLVLTGNIKPHTTDHCPPMVVGIMRDCLQLDSTKRPTAMQLVLRLKSSMFCEQEGNDSSAFQS